MSDLGQSQPDPDDASSGARRRQEAVSEAARAIVELDIDGRTPSSEPWIDDLEQRVRADLGDRGSDDEVVALRLFSWAEEAIARVPPHAAEVGRTSLVARAFETELQTDGKGRRGHGLAPALLAVLETQGHDAYAALTQAQLPESHPHRADHLAAVDAPDGPGDDSRQPNTIRVDDGETTHAASRQLSDFVEQISTAAQGVPTSTLASGLFGKLRDVLRGSPPHTIAMPERGVASPDSLPDALRRRYAIHVSDDRRRISLFEPGSAVPAISLEAQMITTSHDAGIVIADMVALARDRGWQSLKANGTDTFKDAVWLEASKQGISVKHEPAAAVRAAFAKWNEDRHPNRIQSEELGADRPSPRRDDKLDAAFVSRSPEERLVDPRFRNAQLELMIGIRSAEKALGKGIGEMPGVAEALTAAIREQIATGRTFEAPFVRPETTRATARQVAAPKIEADRIPPPRP